jgi:hypothetical protein
MCADIHDGQEQQAPFKGPNTDERDQSLQISHIRLATHGRSIQKCHEPTFSGSPRTLNYVTDSGVEAC